MTDDNLTKSIDCAIGLVKCFVLQVVLRWEISDITCWPMWHWWRGNHAGDANQSRARFIKKGCKLENLQPLYYIKV